MSDRIAAAPAGPRNDPQGPAPRTPFRPSALPPFRPPALPPYRPPSQPSTHTTRDAAVAPSSWPGLRKTKRPSAVTSYDW